MKKNPHTTLPLKERLVNKILIYYQTIWAEKRFNASNHRMWLDNFKENERLNCLFLLSKFMFFGSDEIRELLVAVFRDKYKYKVIESFRKANGDTTDSDAIGKAFQKHLDATRFVALGSASESGSHILMLFRQVNKLNTKLMRNSSDIIQNGKLQEPGVNHYIFIDDFCGSGETAIKCGPLIKKIKAENPAAQVSYFVLFASSTGFENVQKFSDFDNSETIFQLDGTFKCFDKSSRYYADVDSLLSCADTTTFCSNYGIGLVKGTPIDGHPLGFDNGQLLLGFAHNTPDNTLPIFWGEKDWRPMFIRYIKK